jgi:hypothetical protein
MQTDINERISYEIRKERAKILFDGLVILNLRFPFEDNDRVQQWQLIEDIMRILADYWQGRGSWWWDDEHTSDEFDNDDYYESDGLDGMFNYASQNMNNFNNFNKNRGGFQNGT